MLASACLFPKHEKISRIGVGSGSLSHRVSHRSTMATKKQSKASKSADSINARLQLVMKSGKYCLGVKTTLKDFAPGQVQAGSDFQQLPCLAQEWDRVLCNARKDWGAPLPRWQQWAWDCLWALLSSELPVHYRPWRFRHHPHPPRTGVRWEVVKP